MFQLKLFTNQLKTLCTCPNFRRTQFEQVIVLVYLRVLGQLRVCFVSLFFSCHELQVIYQTKLLHDYT